MTPNYSTLEVTVENDVTIAKCIAPVLEFEGNDHPDWENEVDDVISSLGDNMLILDFSNVTVLSSSALQYLIKLLFLSRQGGLRFGLCGFQDNILRVLHVTRLKDMFLIGTDAEEAKAILKGDIERQI